MQCLYAKFEPLTRPVKISTTNSPATEPASVKLKSSSVHGSNERMIPVFFSLNVERKLTTPTFLYIFSYRGGVSISLSVKAWDEIGVTYVVCVWATNARDVSKRVYVRIGKT